MGLCGKEPVPKLMESPERQSISGLEGKVERTFVGSEGYLPGPLPPATDRGIVKPEAFLIVWSYLLCERDEVASKYSMELDAQI